MRAAPVLFASVLVFAAIEGVVFHTGLYPWIISPDSSTGSVETMLRNERLRPKIGAQILGIGDSRMLLEPRISNQYTAETGYTFGNIGTPGATPRAPRLAGRGTPFRLARRAGGDTRGQQ